MPSPSIPGRNERSQQKKLLHIIMSEIIINDLRKIESIKLNINDKLVDYRGSEDGENVEGTSSSLCYEMLV